MDRTTETGIDPLRHLEDPSWRAALEATTWEFARRSIAHNTDRGFWAGFLEFCGQHGRQALASR